MSLKHEVAIQKLQKRVETLESQLRHITTNPTTTSTEFEAVHKGWGKFDVKAVVDPVAADLSKEDAAAKVAELNGIRN